MTVEERLAIGRTKGPSTCAPTGDHARDARRLAAEYQERLAARKEKRT